MPIYSENVESHTLNTGIFSFVGASGGRGVNSRELFRKGAKVEHTTDCGLVVTIEKE